MGNKLILGLTVGLLDGITVGDVGISVGAKEGDWPETDRMETIKRSKNIWMLNIFSIRSATKQNVFVSSSKVKRLYCAQ